MAEKLATLKKKGGAPKVNSTRGNTAYQIGLNQMYQHYYIDCTGYTSIIYSASANYSTLTTYLEYDSSGTTNPISNSGTINCSGHTELHFVLAGTLTASNQWAGFDFSYSLT